MDRGFLFGDGIYEVIPVFNNRPFRLVEHLNRLERSLKAIKLSVEDYHFLTIIQGLIEKNPSPQEQALYLQVTRGATPFRELKIPSMPATTVFAFCSPIKVRDKHQDGVMAITVPDLRWGRCDIKSINLLANILARQQAEEVHAIEALFVRDEHVLEGTASNLFVVKDDTLITPPLGPWILGGVTRELVLELANENGINTCERHLTLRECLEANELWLTSSTKEILPITRLNCTQINQGKIGKLYPQLLRYYQEYKKKLCQFNR